MEFIMRKIFCLVIIFVLASSFVLLNSCADDAANITENNNAGGGNLQNNPESDPEMPVAAENIYEQFEKVDFGGRDLNFLLTDYLNEEHFAESEIGEIFHDAVFRRNKKIEDDFNINFKFVEYGWNDAPDRLRRSVMAGDNAYDLASMHAVAAAGRTTAGIYSDWRTVPVINENLDNDWWNKSVVRDLSIGGKCYFLAGDISYLYIAQTTRLFSTKNYFRTQEWKARTAW
jgi:hypothetical protein